MAVHKAIRSTSSAQRARRRPNHQLKAELFDTLRQLTRGYGSALAALDRLGGREKDSIQANSHLPKAAIFPPACLRDYRNRTEALRALANRDLLRLFAEREEQEAARFTKGAPPTTLRHNRS